MKPQGRLQCRGAPSALTAEMRFHAWGAPTTENEQSEEIEMVQKTEKKIHKEGETAKIE